MDVKITTKRVMVVEDDEFSYLLLKTILEKENLEVIRAVNGEEAMEIFSNDPTIDLILMDLKLPGIGGLEVTQRIREINNNVPIIAETAYALPHDREICLEAGCNDYLSKPIRRNNLLQTLYKYLL
ncbi:MAG: hypothetical protein STSR0006_03520 [Lentimicrobium sp.]|jgi:CheY-like chemotaxis protein